MKEFEVEIDGAVFSVKQIIPEEDTGKYGEEEAELVARACLLAEEELLEEPYSYRVKDKPAKKTETEKVREVFHDKVTEKVKEIFRRNVTEKQVEKQMEALEKTEEEVPAPSLNYRRQIEELSRYLSRDSRRYDGNFEIY